MNEMQIRDGKQEDLPGILRLVNELARYEKAAQEVEVTVEQMKVWGFGKEPVFKCFVADFKGELVGMALYYYKYSTWKGKCIFLEDIIVTETWRRKGIGEKLFRKVLNVAKVEAVKRLEWQVLNWNEPAMAFYRKFQSHFDESWVNCKLTDKELQSL